MAEVTFIVTVPYGTGGGYYIDGVQKPIIPVVTGGTFRFNQNDSSNNSHPLALSTTTSTAGRITTGVVFYLDGVTTSANYNNNTLFNAASVRYIEITVSQTDDFYYICNTHGAGMGNVMDVTYDTWGALAWNDGEWGSQNQDQTVTFASWNQGAWGEGEWGIGYVTTALSTNSGSIQIAIDNDVSISGEILNSTVNTVSITADANLNLSTNLLNTTTGNLSASEDAPTEISTNVLNTTIGAYSITADGTTSEIVVGDSINSTVGVITADGGSSFEVTGNDLSIAIGDESLTGDALIDLTTNLLNTTTGTATGDVATVVLTDVSATFSSGSVSFTIDGSVTLTGVSSSSSIGTLFVTAWAVVDINQTGTWTVVDIAA